MSEFERNDIKLAPALPWLIYGDGYMAQVLSIVAGQNIEGNDVFKFQIIPTPELAKRHNILLQSLDENMSLKVEYPHESVHPLSNDPAFTVYFNFLNYEGQECVATRTLKGAINANTLISLKRIINQLKAENAYLREQLEKARTNVQRFIKEEIMGPATEIGQQVAMQTQMQQGGPVRNQ